MAFQAGGQQSAVTPAPGCQSVLVCWPGEEGACAAGLEAVRTCAATSDVLISVFAPDGALKAQTLVAIPTQFTFAGTHDIVIHKAVAIAAQQVDRLLSGGPWLDLQAKPDIRLASPALSTTMALADYASKMGTRVGEKVARKLKGRSKVWHIEISRGHWQEHLRGGRQVIENPPGRFWADPFLWHRDGRDYLFVEDFDFAIGLAYLSALEIDAEGRVHDLGPCLKEKIHLSFPFLFEWEGQLYMCPETYGDRQIRVYRCDEFPLKWSMHAVLMNGISAADTVLLPHEGRWWMLSNVDSTGGAEHGTELHAFWADTPLSQHWTPHPGNPVLTDATRARNGGLILQGPSVYRVNQIPRYDIYGAGFQVNLLKALSPESFLEEAVARYMPSPDGPELGAHHLSSNGRWTVSDHLQYVPSKR